MNKYDARAHVWALLKEKVDRTTWSLGGWPPDDADRLEEAIDHVKRVVARNAALAQNTAQHAADRAAASARARRART